MVVDDGSLSVGSVTNDAYDLADPPPQPVRPVAPLEPIGYSSRSTEAGGKPTLPLGGRQRMAVVFLLAVAGINLIYGGIELWNLSLLRQAEAGTLTAAQERTFGQVVLGWLGVYAIAALGFLISYMMWQYRAVYNVRQTTGDSRFGPGLSVGGWFIPFANLVMPWLALRDLAERSGVTLPLAVGLWWVAWLASGVASRVADSSYEAALGTGRLETAMTATTVGSGLAVVDALLFAYLAFMVVRITHAQQPDGGPAGCRRRRAVTNRSSTNRGMAVA